MERAHDRTLTVYILILLYIHDYTPTTKGKLTFEQALYSTHFLDHLGKLGVLGEQILYILDGDAGASGHAIHSRRLPGEQLRSLQAVQF